MFFVYRQHTCLLSPRSRSSIQVSRQQDPGTSWQWHLLRYAMDAAAGNKYWKRTPAGRTREYNFSCSSRVAAQASAKIKLRASRCSCRCPDRSVVDGGTVCSLFQLVSCVRYSLSQHITVEKCSSQNTKNGIWEVKQKSKHNHKTQKCGRIIAFIPSFDTHGGPSPRQTRSLTKVMASWILRREPGSALT